MKKITEFLCDYCNKHKLRIKHFGIDKKGFPFVVLEDGSQLHIVLQKEKQKSLKKRFP